MSGDNQTVLEQFVQEIKSIWTKVDNNTTKLAILEQKQATPYIPSHQPLTNNCFGALGGPIGQPYDMINVNPYNLATNYGWGTGKPGDYNNIQLLRRNAMLNDIDVELTKLQGVSAENMSQAQREGISYRIRALQSMYVDVL